ncbi:membrane protein DedA with SNARE-associated domain [Melghirimyces profundicolus]|uniref:Membrane protein DedA with SNARE-associated domain n=2 Tax=Melghirimyces profundicolus TaxID=1242148 RepID=A0A2T6C9A7_9BACL|nr:membrane protein DedA with SNARE-associated domain [Melghirimyces profundicolus]
MFDILSQYGYLGIFFFLMLGIVGLPLPDEILMTFIGYLASIGRLNLFFTFISALSGSVCGITVSYFLGSRLGYPFLKRYGSKIFITRRRLRISQFLFRKYGNWVLFFGYFIPGVRHVTAYMAGISNLSPGRFAAYAYTGALTWCTTFVGLGYLLGAHWENVFHVMHRYGVLFLWIAIPLFLVWVGRVIYQQRNRFNA